MDSRKESNGRFVTRISEARWLVVAKSRKMAKSCVLAQKSRVWSQKAVIEARLAQVPAVLAYSGFCEIMEVLTE